MSDHETRTLHEELEIRVIALLTGELPESEADELEKILSVDESLADFRDRMAGLIGEVHAAREEISLDPKHSEMRLSPERRRTIFPGEVPFARESDADEKKWWHLGLLEWVAVLAAAGLLAAIMIPSVGAVRSVAHKSSTMHEAAQFEAPAAEESSYFALNTQIPQERIEGTPQPIRIPDATPRQQGAKSNERARQIAPLATSEARESDGMVAGQYSGRVVAESEILDRQLAQVEEALDVERAVPRDHIPPEALRLMKRKESLGAKKQALGGSVGESYALGGDRDDVGTEIASLERRSSSDEVGSIDQIETSWAFGSFDREESAKLADREMDVSSASGYRDSTYANVPMSGPVDPFAAPASKPSVQAPSAVTAPTTGSELNGFGDRSLSASAGMDPFAVANTSGVKTRELLQEGRRRYLNGDYDGAALSFDEVVAQDPDNAEAKLFKNKVDKVMESQAEGGEQTRQHMLAQVGQAWERPEVFNQTRPSVAADTGGRIYSKPASIVIPQVNFSGMPLSQVIEIIEKLSVEYDPEQVGIRLDYKPVGGHDPRVNISLRNLSLDRILQFVTQQVNHEFVVMDDHIQVQPAKGQSAIEQIARERSKNTRQRPKPAQQTREAPISTFSLNVSDVSFKLAQAALASQRIPDPGLIRTEEFVNSFSYGDPAPREDEPVALNWEIAQHPYEHNRQVVRFSLQTQAVGRAAGQALNLNVLLDNSGSMQRPDRRAILEQSLEALQSKLTDRDQLNIILFARQPKLIARAGSKSEQQAAVQNALQYRPEGGTNLEAGLEVAYETARQHFDPAASNRVILMTDGAANLGDVDPSALADEVIKQRKRGIALDAYGIGWEDYNDALLEEITRNGDGRYAFLNSVDTAAEDFAEKLAGTLRVAAADVKVQIIWNPERVTTYRQIGYDLHQLKAQDFRDNTVDAAEIGEAEAGTALYVVEINEDPDIVGGLGTLQVRYRVPATGEYVERAWPLEMPRQIPALQEAPASLRLAAASAFFAERLADNPYAANYNFEDLEDLAADLPLTFPAQPRVAELLNMIQSAHALFN